MIKLLNYKHIDNRTELVFEKEQWVKAYKFGKDVYLETSDGITKSAVKEIKRKLEKEGLNADLTEFLNKDYYEYFEENSYN